jgi:hypothetical protein
MYLLTLLSDVDVEFQQFAMDAGCTPQGILPAHLADQVSDLSRNEGPSGPAAKPKKAAPPHPCHLRVFSDRSEQRSV